MTLLAEPTIHDLPDAESLIKEARRLRRRRRLAASSVLLAALILAGGLFAISDGGTPTPPHGSKQPHPRSPTGPIAGHSATRAQDPSALTLAASPTLIGAVAAGGHGSIYYVDRPFAKGLGASLGDISVFDHRGQRYFLTSLHNDRAAGWITDLRSLALVGDALWFSSGGKLYEESLRTRLVRSVAAAPNVSILEPGRDGGLLYISGGASGAVFERDADGETQRLAGGGTVSSTVTTLGVSATKLAVEPAAIAIDGEGDLYIANYLHRSLEVVVKGILYPVTTSAGSWQQGLLASGPNGTVYGIGHGALDRFADRKLTRLFSLPSTIQGIAMQPESLSVSPSGFDVAFSSQTLPSRKAALVEFSQAGKVVTELVTVNNPA